MEKGSWIDRHFFVLFVAIAFGFSWLLFWPNVVAEEALITIPLLLFRILASFGPGLAALLLIWQSEGSNQVKNILRSILSFEGEAKWILTAVLLPLLIIAVPIIILVFKDGLSLSVIPWQGWLMLIPNFVLSLILFGSITDEIGWRGFLLPRLERHYSAFISSLIIGILWGLWQLPTYYFNGVVEINLSPIWLFIEAIALSIILTWLYNSSKSLVVAVIFNGIYRTLVQFFLPVVEVSYHILSFQQLYTTVLVNLALILLLFCGGKTLVFHYQPRRSS